jgi:hypothetical protein
MSICLFGLFVMTERIRRFVAPLALCSWAVYTIRITLHVTLLVPLHVSVRGLRIDTSLSFVAFEVLRAVVVKSTIFWDITLCSPLSDNRRLEGAACHLLLRWFLAELIFSTLKMEAICSSETSIDTQRTTLRLSQKIVFLPFIPFSSLLSSNLFLFSVLPSLFLTPISKVNYSFKF